MLNREGSYRGGMSLECWRVLHGDRLRSMLGRVQEGVSGIFRLHHGFLEFETEGTCGVFLFR